MSNYIPRFYVDVNIYPFPYPRFAFTYAGLLSIVSSGINFSEIWIKYENAFENVVCKMTAT